MVTKEPEDTGVKPFKTKRVVLWTALFILLVIAVPFSLLLSYALTPGPDTGEEVAIVYIPKGASVKEIAGLLDEQGLIRYDRRFLLLARIMGRSSKLQAGEFSLQTGQSPVDVIRELGEARPIEHTITIPEGLNVREIAALLETDGWVDVEVFLRLASDPVFLKKMNLTDVSSLEGYLFPETYRFTRPGPGEHEILAMLVNQSLHVWNRVSAGISVNMSRHDAYILASMVEKESGTSEERPIIAAVFLNRLKKKNEAAV